MVQEQKQPFRYCERGEGVNFHWCTGSWLIISGNGSLKVWDKGSVQKTISLHWYTLIAQAIHSPKVQYTEKEETPILINHQDLAI